MSKDRILIPNSGGIYMKKIDDFQIDKNRYDKTLSRYPGDYSFNTYLIEYFRNNPPQFQDILMKYLRTWGNVPYITPITQGTGTIPNPRGGKVLKVAYFDELKTLWNKYHHRITFTDFELNEFLIKLLRKIPNINLEKYLNARSLMWKKFKLRFPNAKRRDFNNQFTNGDFNIYYKDTPIEVFGDDVSEKKLNDQVKKSLGMSNSFPMSLQSISEKIYPIPGTDYNQKPSTILN